MKRKQLLTKTFLIAAMLFVGMSAWAETVGESDNTSSGVASTPLTLNNGGTIHYVFTTTKNTSANENGWILVANNGSSDIIRLCNNNWELVAAANTGCFSNYNWNTYNADMNGSTVDMTVSLINSVFTMSATITTTSSTEYTYNYIKYLDTTPSSLSIKLEVQLAYLNITTADNQDSQMEIKNVVFGTQSGNAVSVEDFSEATAESSTITGWVDSSAGANTSGTIGLGNITEVAKVSVGSKYTESQRPTYVSGKCIELTSTYSNKASDASNKVITCANYSFTPVSSGLLVFNGDTFRSSDGNINHMHEIAFLDSDGNVVFRMRYENGSPKNLKVYNSSGTEIYYGCYAYAREYTAFGISGLVVDLGTGNCIMTVDYTSGTGANGTRTISKGAFNIGTGKNIAKLRIGRYNDNGYKDTFKTYLDNVSLYSIGTTAAEYDWTINYKVNGEGDNVKTSSGKSTTLGETINAETVFWVGAVKYVLNGSQTTSMNISAGENVLNINVKECDTYTRSYYAVNSSDVKLQEAAIATATTYEDEETTASWPKYLNIGGTWYSTSTLGDGNVTEGGSQNVTFTASDAAYFYEIETLSRSGGSETVTETSYSYSSGSRGRISKGATLYTPALAGGVYSISIPWENGNSSSSEVYVYTRTSGGNLSAALLTFTANQGTGTFTGVITVPDGYSVALNGNEGSNNNNARMDYMTLTPYKVSVTISSSGYTSLSSAYALDFSGVEGLTAFVVTKATSDGVTLSSVEEAPAETGLVLKGKPGDTYSIPAIVSAAEPAVNLLSAAVTAMVVEDGSVYILKGGKFCLLNGATTEAARTIPAGKAYLPKDKVTTSKADLTVAFEEEAVTDIESVQDFKGSKVQGFYDLQGRRVSQPTKGMYIMDGKKVVVK